MVILSLKEAFLKKAGKQKNKHSDQMVLLYQNNLVYSIINNTSNASDIYSLYDLLIYSFFYRF